MGRLVIPIGFALRSGRAYYFICPKSREEHPHVRAFRSWIKQEVAALDWKQVKGAGDSFAGRGSAAALLEAGTRGPNPYVRFVP